MTRPVEGGHWSGCQVLVPLQYGLTCLRSQGLVALQQVLEMTRIDHDFESHRPDRLQQAHSISHGLGTDMHVMYVPIRTYTYCYRGVPMGSHLPP